MSVSKGSGRSSKSRVGAAVASKKKRKGSAEPDFVVIYTSDAKPVRVSKRFKNLSTREIVEKAVGSAVSSGKIVSVSGSYGTAVVIGSKSKAAQTKEPKSDLD